MSKIRYGLVALIIGYTTILLASYAHAGEVFYDAGVETEYVDQRVDVKNEQRRINAGNTIVRPYIAMVYNARDANLFVRADHSKTYRNLDDENLSNNFTEYTYFGDYSIVRDLLVLTARGSQGFRSPAAETFIVDDFLLNTNQLSKTQFNQVSADLSLPRGDYFGLAMSTTYSNQSVRTNENIGNNSLFNGLNNDSYRLSVNAISGEGLRNARISLGAQVSYSERERNANFVSQVVNLNNDIKLIGELGLALNASYENNEVKSDDDDIGRLREFYSAGVGLIWQSDNERSIEVAINRSISDSNAANITDEENEEEENTFLSLDIDWRFSNRTKLEASLSRRFFGDSGSFLLTHSLRNWRTRVTYSEDVNTNLQLLTNNDLGLFICDNGSTDIADCSLTDSLDSPLGPGQVIVPFTNQTLSLNDQIILRRRLSLESAVTRRRTTMSITGTISDETELENDRDFRTEQFGANISFAFSSKTNLKISRTYSRTEGSIDSGPITDATINETNISLTRKLTRRFSASLAFRKLDRDGELNRNSITGGIDGPFTDNRITFSVKYNYGNRR